MLCPPQPNSNLFEICYKEHIQQFDDDEEEEGLDGEDSWHQKALDFPGGTTHLARPRYQLCLWEPQFTLGSKGARTPRFSQTTGRGVGSGVLELEQLGPRATWVLS